LRARALENLWRALDALSREGDVAEINAILVSALLGVGAIALDFGTLQQMTSLLAYLREVDPVKAEKEIRNDWYYRLRLAPGLLAVMFLVSIPPLYPTAAATLAICALTSTIAYFSLQAWGIRRVSRALSRR
jgi:hypothetical protein